MKNLTTLRLLPLLCALVALPTVAEADHGHGGGGSFHGSGGWHGGGSFHGDHHDFAHHGFYGHGFHHFGPGFAFGFGYYPYSYGWPYYGSYYDDPYYYGAYYDYDPGAPVYRGVVAHTASSGNLVTDVQRALKHRGYNPGAVDGQSGPATRDAIRAYQGDRGMPVTGHIDSGLVRSLGLG
ncbi:MAG TPA: peptidoglycan-binding domain-containing protein [Chthoniobacteraceae bacterium]